MDASPSPTAAPRVTTLSDWLANDGSVACEPEALLVPHDGLDVRDVSGSPTRWAELAAVRRALVAGVPVLGWGSGAALLGRAAGAEVVAGGEAGVTGRRDSDALARLWRTDVRPWREVSRLPRGAHALVWSGAADAELPLVWQLGPSVGWAAAALPDAARGAFVAGAAAHTERFAVTPLDAVGGEARLRAALARFYVAARADDVLGEVFAAHVVDWEAHLSRVTDFWVTVLGGGARYGGGFAGAHAGLGVRGLHVERWLDLFASAVRAELGEDAGGLLEARARQMARRLAPRS